MITPRCDMFFDVNLINLRQFQQPIDNENIEMEEYINTEEMTNKIKSHAADEIKEIIEKIDEVN
ncbi:hypothetical protein ACAG39_09115 [Caldicellulosiruptoraceae bacterium PP1]